MTTRLQDLQGAALDVFLDQGGDRAFAQDAIAFGAHRGLDGADQEALDRFKPRLLLYRDLVRGALEDPLPDCFPFTHQILNGNHAWEDCMNAFLASRSIQSPYYRDVNPAFVAWLAESGWGQDRWPYLLQLAHYEWTELEVLRWPDSPESKELLDAPDGHCRVIFDGAARNLSYGWRVHESDEASPLPAGGAAHLFCYRDGDLDFRTRELAPAASAFLVRCAEGQDIGTAAQGFGLAEGQILLRELRSEGAILGFR